MTGRARWSNGQSEAHAAPRAGTMGQGASSALARCASSAGAQRVAREQAWAAASRRLQSPQWFRVAHLKPRLDEAAVEHRQVVRGQVWRVLVPVGGGRSVRLDAIAWRALARCDGRLSLQQLWDLALGDLGDAAPTQDEWLAMLAQLHQAGLMSFDRPVDFGGAAGGGAADRADDRADDRAAAPAAGAAPAAEGARSILQWRMPLGDPDAHLARWAASLPWLFGRAALGLWLVALALAAVALVDQGERIFAPLQAEWASPRLWWMAALVYLPIKLLHELAHGLAARHFGAPVRQWGIGWMAFMPLPYVDASAASALPRARQRLVVAGAGVALELALAACAVPVALMAQPGPLRDAALVVFHLCVLGTLLVNANPLLRFDGYHAMCDALGLPNLAVRSARHWLWALRRHGLGLAEPPAVQPALGETPWLWAYAPLALLMRLALLGGLVMWVGGHSAWLGAAVAGLVLASVLGPPLRGLWRWLQGGALSGRRQRGARWRLALGSIGLALPLLVWPWPDSTVLQGVRWLPDAALVRAETDGVVERVWVADGQAVTAGQPVLQLRSPELAARLAALQARIEGLQSLHMQALAAGPGGGAAEAGQAQAAEAEHALEAAEAERVWLQQRQADLVVRARVAGRIAISRPEDWPLRSVRRGDLLAHVLTGEPGQVQIAIPQAEAARLAGWRGAVQVRPVAAGAAPLSADWSGLVSGGQWRLPSAALGAPAGGPIDTDPADASGLKPLQPVVLAQLQLSGAAPLRLGERLWVRVVHGHAPLAAQMARWVQQQVLRRFDPAR